MRKAIWIIVVIVIIIFAQINFNNYNEHKESENNYRLEKKMEEKDISKQNIDLKIIKLAHYFPESHPQHMALNEKFIPIVESNSDWKIKVEVYPNNQLGSEEEYIQGVLKGTIEMCLGFQSLTDLFTKFKILEFPYIFDNSNQIDQILNGSIGKEITKGIDAKGVKCLAWSLNGFGELCTTEKLEHYDSINRLNIATSFSEYNIQFLKKIDFDVYPVPLRQLSMSLDQNLAGGHDMVPLLSYDNRLYDITKNVYVTNHIISPDMYLINNNFWETLSEKNRDIILMAAKESAKYEIELLQETEKSLFESLQKKGVVVIQPDISPYKKAAESLHDEWIDNDINLNELYTMIQKEKVKISNNSFE